MCGRYVSAHTAEELADYFGATQVAGASLEASYNVAPTNDVYSVLLEEGVRRLVTMRWGLIPSWAKDLKVGSKMINARAETLAERNAYRGPFKKRRCLIPADGFYEWAAKPGQKHKQPVYITRSDRETMAFAGIWDRWQSPDAPPNPSAQPSSPLAPAPLRSASIITCRANERIAEVHNRMPAVLPPGAWDAWLDPANDDVTALSRLLVPAPSQLFEIIPVSLSVNNPRNKGADLILPQIGGDA